MNMFGTYNRFYYNFFSEMSCVSLNTEKTEIRAVIKYFHLKGLKAKEIKSELDSTLEVLS